MHFVPHPDPSFAGYQGRLLQSRHQWGQRKEPSNREGLAEDALRVMACSGLGPKLRDGCGGMGGRRLPVPAAGSSWSEGHTWCMTGFSNRGRDKAQGSVGVFLLRRKCGARSLFCHELYLTRQGYRDQGQASACRAKGDRTTGCCVLLPVYEQA